jgi:predicted O-methyltransferase YrrM
MSYPSIQEGLQWVFGTPGRIQQQEWECMEFLFRVKDELKPERTVELGTWKGGNAILLSLVTSKITISLDIHDYDRNEAINYIRNNGLNATLPLADCRAPETIANTKMCLDGPIDLLFIDDGHCIEEVTEDHRLWAPLVRSGGWIVFHDINPDANLLAPGVHPSICQAHAYWADLKGNKEEIIYSGDPPGPGIGILKVP